MMENLAEYGDARTSIAGSSNSRRRRKMPEIKTLNIDELEPNSWNDNIMSEEMFNHLKKTMGRFGNLQPILAWSHVDRTRGIIPATRNIIIDGEHRWKADKENGATTIKCVMISDQDIIEYSKKMHEEGFIPLPLPDEIGEEFFKVVVRILTVLMNDIKGEPDPVKRGETYLEMTKVIEVKQLGEILNTAPEIIESHKTLLEMDQSAIEADLKTLRDKPKYNEVKLLMSNEEFDKFQNAAKETGMKDHLAAVMFMCDKILEEGE
jgi:hypothetical protein